MNQAHARIPPARGEHNDVEEKHMVRSQRLSRRNAAHSPLYGVFLLEPRFRRVEDISAAPAYSEKAPCPTSTSDAGWLKLSCHCDSDGFVACSRRGSSATIKQRTRAMVIRYSLLVSFTRLRIATIKRQYRFNLLLRDPRLYVTRWSEQSNGVIRRGFTKPRAHLPTVMRIECMSERKRGNAPLPQQ